MKLFIIAKPNSKKESVVRISENTYQIAVRDAPERGKANQAIIKKLAEYLRIPERNIEIVHGHTSRKKLIQII